MMKYTALFALIIFLSAGCGGQNQENESDSESVDTTSASEQSTNTELPDGSEKMVVEESTQTLEEMSIIHKREFSNPGSTDVFTLDFEGDKLATSTAVFRIKKENGEVIYEDRFEAKFLTGQLDQTIPVDEELIREKAKQFFSPDKFKPVKRSEIPFDPNFVTKEVYEEVMSDPDRLAYYYVTGYENVRTLAYSNKLGKVVLLFNCC